MSQIISLSFDSTPVSFNSNGYLNATSIAAKFGKRASDYLRSQSTKDYIEAITRKRVMNENQLVTVKKGGNVQESGTWLHNKLAIDFARWLNPDFAVWCDEQIEVILHPPLIANRLSDKADRVPLKDAVNLLVAKAKNLNYSEAYTMVHQRFNIESVDELTAEQLPAVVEYVHRMIGSWEHAPIALPTAAPQIDPSQLTVHRNHVLHMYQTARQLVREIDMLGMTQEDLPKYLLA